ncbi:hypothetical protein QO004_003195 [Rhizobium mesoamericanum]|nr:hypothetical protein [Rhizobium mesoamericanum]
MEEALPVRSPIDVVQQMFSGNKRRFPGAKPVNMVCVATKMR